MEPLDSLHWRKSSFSGGNSGNCVQVAQGGDDTILVRDTKNNGSGPVNQYTRGEWQAFLSGVRNGEFDLDESGCLI